MKRGEIYLLAIKKKQDDSNVQAGFRPVIIVQNDFGNVYSPTTIVCAITSKPKKWLPTHCFIPRGGGLKDNSTALCEQIFTVDKTFLTHRIGAITNKRILNQLDKCIRMSLGIYFRRHKYD